MPSSKPSNPSAALKSTAIRFLSARPRFKAEVINRLAAKAEELKLADPLSLIDQIVESLEKSGFLDDEKLLESFIRNRLIEKKKGPYWIRQRLVHLGLSKIEIDNALKKFADKPTQLTVLRDYLGVHPVGSDPKTKARLFRRLASRGFAASTIVSAFDGLPPKEV